MKIIKNSSQVTALRQTKEFELTVTNDKGEEIEITLSTWFVNDEYDNDFGEDILDKTGKIVLSEDLKRFLGEEYDDFMDEIGNIK